MNMRILFSVLLLAVASFAQGLAPGVQTDCFDFPLYVTHETIDFVKGMQLKVAETDSSNLENEPSIEHTVDISGIVDSVIDTAYVTKILKDGTETNQILYSIYGNDNPMTEGHRVVLRNFKAVYSKESPMTKVLDSSYIFIPYDIKVGVSDSIYIKGYSALYTSIWDEGLCTTERVYYLAGEFSVFPSEVEGTTSIKKNAPASERARKGHNRDAAGKALNACNARKAKF